MAGNRHVFLASALILASGCYQGSDVEADIATTRDVHFNSVQLQGVQLQGVQLQGVQLQGVQLQGVQLQGVQLQGVQLQGVQLQGVQLQGTEFQAYYWDKGKKVFRSGEDMIGTRLTLKVTVWDGWKKVTESFELRFDDIYPDGINDDVFLYDVSYRPVSSDTWQPLCGDGKGGALPAIPLQNYWDPKTGDRIDDEDVVTFACTNAVLAKCVEWGYRPWAEATRCKDDDKKKKHCYDVSLQDYHQACTRMARADYCGNGEPWTVPGTAIDIWDRLSPQIEKQVTDWTIEAEWTPEGAYCLDDIRQQAWKEQGKYPKCFLDKKGKPEIKKDCGSMKKHRALLVSAFDKYGEGMP